MDLLSDETSVGPNTSLCINSMIPFTYVALDGNLTQLCLTYIQCSYNIKI
jgi:hypothetical protein